MTERKGIEIDYCPACRGVWLDRGELDKLIERSAEWDDDDDRPQRPSAPPAYPAHSSPAPPPPPPSHPYGYHKDLDDSKYGYKYKKPKKWWHEIFD